MINEHDTRPLADRWEKSRRGVIGCSIGDGVTRIRFDILPLSIPNDGSVLLERNGWGDGVIYGTADAAKARVADILRKMGTEIDAAIGVRLLSAESPITYTRSHIDAIIIGNVHPHDGYYNRHLAAQLREAMDALADKSDSAELWHRRRALCAAFEGEVRDGE